MKTKLVLLALIAGTVTALPVPPAKASDYADCEQRVIIRTVERCRPVKVCTHEVCRRSFCRVSYDDCGYPVTRHFTQVTFQEEFSDGSTRSFTRTFSRG